MSVDLGGVGLDGRSVGLSLLQSLAGGFLGLLGGAGDGRQFVIGGGNTLIEVRDLTLLFLQLLVGLVLNFGEPLVYDINLLTDVLLGGATGSCQHE